jgi:hypothetical protein
VPLFAPLAVSVEVRSADQRVFRLSRAVADTALALERPAPFEIGRPVTATFALPDDRLADDRAAEPLVLRAVVAPSDADGDGEHGGRTLEFLEPPGDAQDAVGRYVRARLGLRP